ncbi:MAG: CoA transferase, partial [Halobacteriovoraceae bacterium]|nr:CoA transferase [Halobacteriovoraceae bacterium]
SPLEGIKVLDLSQRLPGPMAGYLFAQLGAEVSKWEDLVFGDPFVEGLFKEMDPSFSQWYDELNGTKKIVKKDFKDSHFAKELRDEILRSDIVIMGLPLKLQKKFEVTKEDLENEKSTVVILEMTASHNQTIGLHDLNILAMKNLLHLHVRKASREKRLAPPFLPVAGIGYGTSLALHGLAHLQKAKAEKRIIHHKLSLEESVEEIYSPFYSSTLQESGQDTFLHNGRYPCYSLYPLKDQGWLAVASLEEKYWERFTSALAVDLKPEDRFHNSDDSVFNLLEKRVKEISYKDAQNLFNQLDACVTPYL